MLTQPAGRVNPRRYTQAPCEQQGRRGTCLQHLLVAVVQRVEGAGQVDAAGAGGINIHVAACSTHTSAHVWLAWQGICQCSHPPAHPPARLPGRLSAWLARFCQHVPIHPPGCLARFWPQLLLPPLSFFLAGLPENSTVSTRPLSSSRSTPSVSIVRLSTCSKGRGGRSSAQRSAQAAGKGWEAAFV